ncbi:TPA: ATPase, partial [Pseudomonas aeruginosa]|nr:ATPase [Pseudomonas aeruginosa]
VEAEDGENQLQVPSWFWNSSEWASFTQASPKAQLPLLKRSLRAMRNEEFDLQTNLDVEVKKYLGTILVSLKADKSKGAAALNDFPGAKNLLAKINTWRQSLEEYKERLVTTHPELDKLIVSIQDFCVQREGRYPDYNAKVSAVDN